MAGIYHYLSPLTWDTDQGGCWRAPDGCVLGLDLRSLPDQALAGTFGDWPYCYVLSETQQSGDDFISLGSGRVEEVRPASAIADAWESSLGIKPIGDTLLDWIWHLATEQANADGSTPLKPLVPTRDGDVELFLPLHSLVLSQKFGVWNPTGNRHHNIVRDLLRADLKQHDDECKAEAKALKEWEKELRKQGRIDEADKVAQQAAKVEYHAEKVLDAMCRKYDCEPTQLSATIRRGKASTTITDAFGGTLGSWTAVSGTWAIDGGKLKLTNYSAVEAIRHNTALSSSDHYAQCVVGSDGSGTTGPCTRFSGSALTCYNLADEDYFTKINKIVSGTATSLTSNGSYYFTDPDTMKLNSSGSTQTGYYNATQCNQVTDTAITTGTQVGIAGQTGNTRWDDFEASDGLADGPPLALKKIIGGGIL